jgi:hypothetical protein
MTFLVDQLGAGIHDDVPGEDYYPRRLGEANKGALDVIARTPFHYQHWCGDSLADVDERKAFVFGRAWHCMLLEPDRFDAAWAVMPRIGNRSTADRQARVRFQELNAGKDLIAVDEYDKARRMVDAIRLHPLANALTSGGGRTERTVVWRDPDTDLPCKCRLDYHDESRALVLDPKSCDDASPEAFARSAFRYRYHVQNAHYTEACRVVGEPLDYFLFLCVEKDPPHAVAIYKINAPGAERGWELRQRNMARLARAIRENHFPSYNDDKTAELQLPAFAFYEATDL